MIKSKFAEISDLNDPLFKEVNAKLQELNILLDLPDHTQLNAERFNNEPLIMNSGTYYGARMWEYPFAIINAEIKQGQKIADIGCGSTPFTLYLADQAGPKNVTGFDNDFLKDDDTHFAFGVRKNFIKDSGINFKFSGLDNIDSPDNIFDTVFCISVLEHIEEPTVWQNGLMEMARILKPGGRLIITFDVCLTHRFLSVGDMLNFTGLVPLGLMDMNWPEKRFVKVDGIAMDVFGIVLTKPEGIIFSDNSNSKSINRYEANKKYIPEMFNSGQLQIARDLKRGFAHVFSKLILNKYKK
jgi:SAM-dependent methyltransferase